jgi:hypothetical protein
MLGKSLGVHTEDRTYALKLTRRRIQSTTRIKSNLLQTIVQSMK